jgi:predicted PurR-regulated permease PerM
MAVATTLVLWGVGVKGAIPLGIASGFLNLLPFLGLIASLALPLAAALLQFNTPGPYIVITLTILSCMSCPRIFLFRNLLRIA